MKTNKILSLGAIALATLGLAACSQQEEIAPQQPNIPAARTFTAIIEQPANTRTTGNHETGKFSWVVGDEINLLNETESTTVEITSVADGKGTFEVSGTENYEYATYPYGTSITIDNTNGVPTGVLLTDYYDYVADKSIPSVNAPMYAVLGEESTTANFRHLGGVIAFTINNVPAGDYTFKFQTDRQITNFFEVDNTAVPQIKAGEASSTKNMVEIFSRVATDGSTLTFYVPVPVGEYNNFTVELSNSSTETTYSKAASTTGNIIDRGTLGVMPALDVNDMGVYTPNYTYDESYNLYIVYNAKGLTDVQQDIKSNRRYSANITLAADITLPAVDEGESNWTPIGVGNLYTGTFDGGGHTICGLTIESESEYQYQGLIYSLGEGGTVKNLILEGCTVKGTSNVGAFAGHNSGTILNCTLKSSLSKNVNIIVTTTGLSYLGGIAGNSFGTIDGCRVIKNGGKILIQSGISRVGGIAGNISGSITNCAVEATTSGGIEIIASTTFAGGIVGSLTQGSISNVSVKNVKIQGATDYIGGIVGHLIKISNQISGNITVQGCAIKSESGSKYTAIVDGGNIYTPAEGDVVNCTNNTVNGVLIASGQSNE